MRPVSRSIHWRRYRTRALIRLWDKDFALIGQQQTATCVEPWARWARRIAADIAVAVRLRREHHRTVYRTIDQVGPRRSMI